MEPISKLLLQYLRDESDATIRAITALVEQDENRGAAVAIGGLRFAETLLKVLHPPERHKPEPEEPFVDPAAIRKEVRP
jgi:hypothetical protein